MALVSTREAAVLLRAGELVGLPTETVYGLAANGLDPVAVQRVYALKGRPAHHPLILHVLDDPDEYVFMDDRAWALVAAFWPGPLTLVLPRRPGVPDVLTWGHPTLAVRSPDHAIAREVMRLARVPLAAPSANRFGRVSPTTAAHVLAEFPNLPVVDGGTCLVGLESTVLDLTGDEPALLRPGGIPVEELEDHLGPITRTTGAAAPGTLGAHYGTRAAVIVADDPEGEAVHLRAQGHRVAVLDTSDPSLTARSLYAWLRGFEDDGAEVIVAGRCPDVGLGRAVNDRLRRASATRALPIRSADGTP